MNFLLRILAAALGFWIAAHVVRGVHVHGLTGLVLAGLLLGLFNALIRPILLILTLPLTIVTLGLFILVINAVLVLLVAAVVPGFKVDSFWSALLFSLVLSLVSWFLHSLAE